MKKNISKTIAGAVSFAALYTVIVYTLAPISYREVQMRIADALVGLIPLMGWSGIIGYAFGVFLSNILSPLGWIDLLSTIPSFILGWVVWKLRKVSVFLGLTIHSIVLGCVVGLMLNYVFDIPFLFSIAYVSVGIFVSSAIFGYILYKAVARLRVLQKWFGE